MTYRYINTATWNDPWFEEISPSGKLLFIYLCTNDHTNQAGIVQLSMKRISNDTGLSRDEVAAGLEELSGKVIVRDSWIWVKNFFRYQKMNDSFACSAYRAAELSPFSSEWKEYYKIDGSTFKKKEPKKNILQSSAEQEVSPPSTHNADTVSTPCHHQNENTPVPPEAKTSIDSSSDRNELAAALGKIQVSEAEMITWQQLKKLKCLICDVEAARKRIGKNSLNYLKNSICEERDKRAADKPAGVDLEEYFGKGTKLQ